MVGGEKNNPVENETILNETYDSFKAKDLTPQNQSDSARATQHALELLHQGLRALVSGDNVKTKQIDIILKNFIETQKNALKRDHHEAEVKRWDQQMDEMPRINILLRVLIGIFSLTLIAIFVTNEIYPTSSDQVLPTDAISLGVYKLEIQRYEKAVETLGSLVAFLIVLHSNMFKGAGKILGEVAKAIISKFTGPNP